MVPRTGDPCDPASAAENEDRGARDGTVSAMTKAPSRDVQRALFQALRDRPLDLMNEADRKLYEPLHEPHHDPVQRLFDTIDFSGAQSVQLVAGFRGTGKSTELSRLEKKLWESDFHVIRVDLDRHVDMTSPVDIREFLLILAGAMTEQLTKESLLGADKQIEKSLFERAKALLPTTKEITAKGGIVDIKLALRGDAGFRGQVRTALAGRVGELESQIRGHQDDIRKALSKRAGRPVRLVVIIDSLEHLRGTGENSEEVRRSVEELFFTHASRISLPETHMVLSVPAFLALHGDNLAAQFVNGQVQAWPAFRVKDRSGHATNAVEGMVQLVERRGDWRAILPGREALVKLILASGGHLRDLLNMLIESIHVAGGGVTDDAAERIIKIAQRAYLPLYKDEIEILHKIADDKGLAGIDLDKRDYVQRFLDAGLVLCYMNDDFWYDVHPLVREVVTRS